MTTGVLNPAPISITMTFDPLEIDKKQTLQNLLSLTVSAKIASIFFAVLDMATLETSHHLERWL